MNRYQDLNWRKEFGKRLKKTRRFSGFSRQESFAKEVAVSPHTVSMYERGEVSPKAEIVVKMANALNCTTDYLLLLDDSPNHERSDSETVTGASSRSIKNEKLIMDTYATIEKSLESIRNDVAVPSGQNEAVLIESLVNLLRVLVGFGCP